MNSCALVFHKGLSDSVNAGLRAPIEFFYDASKEAELGILKGALIGNLMKIVGSQSYQKMAVTQFDKRNPGNGLCYAQKNSRRNRQ